MATVYKFQVSMPLTDLLPRNRISNTIHLQHTIGSLLDADLSDMCDDIVALYQAHYGNTTNEISCKAYDTDAVPNYPRAETVVNAGIKWDQGSPREICLVLSYAGQHRGNKRERGRIYLQPQLVGTLGSPAMRPSQAHLDWALAWYTTSNQSFPDLGGVDWQFGIWSTVGKYFTTSQQAWVNDDWDVQRRRGLRESTRVTATRQG